MGRRGLLVGITTPTKDPAIKVITDLGFVNFDPLEDLPAVMFTNGIVDSHHAINICGLVYGPSFVEIENHEGAIQYVNGAIFGGGGIFLKAHDGGLGVIAIRQDPNTMDKLAVMNSKGKGLIRIGFAIER